MLFPLNILARRFVAGETAEEAIAASRAANARGMAATLDYLGKDVAAPDDARKEAAEYCRLLGLIHELKVQASILLKVSHMGLLISREECTQNTRRVAEEAARLGLFVWFDMEGSALTQKTIEMFEALRVDFSNIGLCLQAYLVRTGGDLDKLMRSLRRSGGPLNVRFCRGDYRESTGISYPSKSAVDGNFRMLVQKVFDQNAKQVIPAFAIQDQALIEFVIAAAAEKKIGIDRFEFQMLYGPRNQFLAGLAQRGFRTSVHIPYGSHWGRHLARRLRECKEIVYLMLGNLFRA
jgi:proline dehydrogenase